MSDKKKHTNQVPLDVSVSATAFIVNRFGSRQRLANFLGVRKTTLDRWVDGKVSISYHLYLIFRRMDKDDETTKWSRVDHFMLGEHDKYFAGGKPNETIFGATVPTLPRPREAKTVALPKPRVTIRKTLKDVPE